METSLEAKAVRMPLFSGKKKDFSVWWKRFSAYAVVHKFDHALKEKEADMPDKDSDEIDETTNEGKKKVAAKRRNEVAMATFTNSFTTEALMGMITKASTAD